MVNSILKMKEDQEMKKSKKLGNKGFSLVELIVVIAILAILAGALAPQFIKYIGKSRESSDAANCASIKSSFEAALSEDKAYNSAIATTYYFNGSIPDFASPAQDDLKAEITSIVKSWPSVKEKDKKSFAVTITSDRAVSVVTSTVAP